MDALHIVLFVLGLLVAFGGWRLHVGLTRLFRALLGDALVGPLIFMLAGTLLIARLYLLEMPALSAAATIGICLVLAVVVHFAVRDMYFMFFLSGAVALLFTGWLVLFPDRPSELLDVALAPNVAAFYQRLQAILAPTSIDLLLALAGGCLALAFREHAIVYATAIAGSAMVGFGWGSPAPVAVVLAISVLHQYYILRYNSEVFWHQLEPAHHRQTGLW